MWPSAWQSWFFNELIIIFGNLLLSLYLMMQDNICNNRVKEDRPTVFANHFNSHGSSCLQVNVSVYNNYAQQELIKYCFSFMVENWLFMALNNRIWNMIQLRQYVQGKKITFLCVKYFDWTFQYVTLFNLCNRHSFSRSWADLNRLPFNMKSVHLASILFAFMYLTLLVFCMSVLN